MRPHDAPIDTVKEILFRVCGVEPSAVVPGAKLVGDLGVDSLGMLECIIEFEEAFNITIDASKVSPEVTVQHVIDLIQTKEE